VGGGSARSVSITPGEAGGDVEETFTTSATVRAVDTAARKLTLEGQNGATGTFAAPKEMRNLDQVRVGDKVTATVVSRLTVFVDKEGDPGSTHAAALVRAPEGSKPGGIIAESYEIVGTIKSIDTVNRRATIEFSGGETKTVPVRADVDLGRYKAGDNLVIRATQALSVVVKAP
jgi:hypothetical protein